MFSLPHERVKYSRIQPNIKEFPVHVLNMQLQDTLQDKNMVI